MFEISVIIGFSFVLATLLFVIFNLPGGLFSSKDVDVHETLSKTTIDRLIEQFFENQTHANRATLQKYMNSNLWPVCRLSAGQRARLEAHGFSLHY